MRGLSLCILTVALTLLTGCHLTRRASFGQYNQRQFAERPNSSLLFDRFPGQTFAANIAPRSDWPTAINGNRVRERVLFDEYFQDRQGNNLRSDNTFYRLFTTRRAGVIER